MMVSYFLGTMVPEEEFEAFINPTERVLSTKPDLKMQDIANKCGFSSRQALHRAFLRETGITPREFLAQPNNQ